MATHRRHRQTRKLRKYSGGTPNQNAELLKIKNKLTRVNKSAIRPNKQGKNLYNISHHPWNNGFK
uniref:Uncharacterized protein n=1 Tax=viral metagenome TaxID=1070528 RepID=A0A6C0IAI8_9ZZZZ